MCYTCVYVGFLTSFGMSFLIRNKTFPEALFPLVGFHFELVWVFEKCSLKALKFWSVAGQKFLIFFVTGLDSYCPTVWRLLYMILLYWCYFSLVDFYALALVRVSVNQALVFLFFIVGSICFRFHFSILRDLRFGLWGLMLSALPVQMVVGYGSSFFFFKEHPNWIDVFSFSYSILDLIYVLSRNNQFSRSVGRFISDQCDYFWRDW